MDLNIKRVLSNKGNVQEDLSLRSLIWKIFPKYYLPHFLVHRFNLIPFSQRSREQAQWMVGSLSKFFIGLQQSDKNTSVLNLERDGLKLAMSKTAKPRFNVHYSTFYAYQLSTISVTNWRFSKGSISWIASKRLATASTHHANLEKWIFGKKSLTRKSWMFLFNLGFWILLHHSPSLLGRMLFDVWKFDHKLGHFKIKIFDCGGQVG